MMKIAIIPARANSKGIPRKNLQQVGGVSLVGRAIQAAKMSGIFDRIIVSTDGDEIAEDAIFHSAEVVRRPPGFATDSSKTIDSIVFTLESQNITDGICVLLQPTSPLRSSDDICQSMSLFMQSEMGSVVSVCEAEHHPYKSLIEVEGKAVPILKLDFMEAPRQSLPLAYRTNGAIYINTIQDLLKYKTFFVNPVKIHKMSYIASIDIDTEDDLTRANTLLEHHTHV